MSKNPKNHLSKSSHKLKNSQISHDIPCSKTFKHNHSLSISLTLSDRFPLHNLQNKKSYRVTTIPKNQKEVNVIMSEYIYTSSKNSSLQTIGSILTPSKQSLYNTKREEVSKIMDQSKYIKRRQSISPNINEDCKTQIYLNERNFSDPLGSLETITRNKAIHDKLLVKYQNRELALFNRTVSQSITKEVEKKISSRAKVSAVLPKIVEQSFFLNKENWEKQRRQTLKKVKDVISIPTLCFIDGCVPLLTKILYPPKNFPESREQFSFCVDPFRNYIYLYGGYSSNTSVKPLWRLETTKFTWERVVTSSVQPESRTGHTGLIYKNKYIIFGGTYVTVPVMADLDVFNTENKTWSSPEISTVTNLKLRKHHVACIVGHQMFIHGGIAEGDQYLNDCHLLYLNPYKWQTCNIASNTESPTLAMHSCALVIQSEISSNPKFNIYRLTDQSKKQYSRIKERGIYIFGGKSRDEQGPNNILRVLRIGKKPLEWVSLDTKGKPPSPRYLASMSFFEEGNYLIVHGGRNNLNDRDFAFNDTYVFDLYRMEWLRVAFNKNLTIQSRYSHGAAINGKHLYIFGGINHIMYLGSALTIINLDPEMVSRKDYEMFGLEKKGKEKKNERGLNN